MASAAARLVLRPPPGMSATDHSAVWRVKLATRRGGGSGGGSGGSGGVGGVRGVVVGGCSGGGGGGGSVHLTRSPTAARAAGTGTGRGLLEDSGGGNSATGTADGSDAIANPSKKIVSSDDDDDDDDDGESDAPSTSCGGGGGGGRERCTRCRRVSRLCVCALVRAVVGRSRHTLPATASNAH